MLGFRRRSDDSRWQNADFSIDYTAIPLTPAEASLLVEALHESDRLSRTYFWSHRGSDVAIDEAASILRRAGVASALGHQTVPLLVRETHMYKYALMTHQEYAPRAKLTRDFQILLARFHAMSGVARVSKWRARHDPENGLVWDGMPPSTEDARRGFPKIAS